MSVNSALRLRPDVEAKIAEDAKRTADATVTELLARAGVRLSVLARRVGEFDVSLNGPPGRVWLRFVFCNGSSFEVQPSGTFNPPEHRKNCTRYLLYFRRVKLADGSLMNSPNMEKIERSFV